MGSEGRPAGLENLPDGVQVGRRQVSRTWPGCRSRSIADAGSAFSPSPRAWPSSWVTTDWKSYWFGEIVGGTRAEVPIPALDQGDVAVGRVGAEDALGHAADGAGGGEGDVDSRRSGVRAGDLHEVDAQRGDLGVKVAIALPMAACSAVWWPAGRLTATFSVPV